MELLFIAGSTSLVEGLSVEAGVQLNTTTGAEKTIIAADGTYAMSGLTVGASFMTDTESDTDGSKQAFGAGLAYDMDVDDMTAVNVSVSLAGDDDETMRALGAGVGVTYGDFGADVDLAYAMAVMSDFTDVDGVAADGDLLGVDISGHLNVGSATFTVGYAVTDFGWESNSRATMPTEGGAYMKLTCDF